MFFTEIHLTWDHWSFKLLQYVFPGLNRFDNFCPHFWLSLLAIIIVPFVALIKGFGKVGSYIAIPIGKLINWFEAHAEKRKATGFAKLGDLEKQLGAFIYNNDWINLYNIESCERHKLQKYLDLYRCCRDKDKYKYQYNFIYRWSRSHLTDRPLTKEEIEIFDIINSYKLEPPPPKINLSIRFETVKKEHKTALATMMWIGKYIAAPILGIILLAVALIIFYYFILLLGWLWYWIVYFFSIPGNAAGFFKLLGFLCGGIFIGFLLITAGVGIKEYFETRPDPIISCESKRAFWRTVGTPFIWVVVGITSVVSFLWLGIKTFKSNNCPAIIWEEKKE